MSEVVEAAAPESAPSSTADVATQVLETFESQETAPAEEAPAAIDAPEPELTAAQKFLLEQGHRADNGRGGKTYLPYQTVEKMLDRYISTHQKTWESEKGTLSTRAEQLQAAVDGYLAAIKGDPKQFLSEAAQLNPAFRSLLEPPAPVEQPKPPSDMPPPDVQLPDGSRTYSIDGLKALLEWNTAAVEARLMPKLDERLKPWEERDKEEQTRTRVRSQIETAKTWEKWGDWEGDILAKLQADTQAAQQSGRRPQMSLREAYLEVKAEKAAEEAKKLAADRQEVRGDVIKELQSAPKSTSIPRTAGATPAPVKPRSTSEVAARNLERLERGA